MIFIPHKVWNREETQLILDCKFDFNITDIVGFECFPLVRGIGRIVSCTATICFGCLAGNTKITNKVFAFFHLLVLQFKYRTDAFKGSGWRTCRMPERNWNGRKGRNQCHRRCLRRYRRIISIQAGRVLSFFEVFKIIINLTEIKCRKF